MIIEDSYCDEMKIDRPERVKKDKNAKEKHRKGVSLPCDLKCARVPMSLKVLMLFLQKYVVQCCDITKLDCAHCAGQ